MDKRRVKTLAKYDSNADFCSLGTLHTTHVGCLLYLSQESSPRVPLTGPLVRDAPGADLGGRDDAVLESYRPHEDLADLPRHARPGGWTGSHLSLAVVVTDDGSVDLHECLGHVSVVLREPPARQAGLGPAGVVEALEGTGGGRRDDITAVPEWAGTPARSPSSCTGSRRPRRPP